VSLGANRVARCVAPSSSGASAMFGGDPPTLVGRRRRRPSDPAPNAGTLAPWFNPRRSLRLIRSGSGVAKIDLFAGKDASYVRCQHCHSDRGVYGRAEEEERTS
jgi:hypothetical protein